MKRLTIIFSAVAALCIASCRREAPQQTTTAAGSGAQTGTVAGEPKDLRNARVNAVLAPDTGQYVTNARIGPALGADGMVAEEKTEFTAGQDIHLSLWLKESPPGLQTSARVEDPSGKEVDIELKPMKGEKTVTFTLGDRKLAPGKYKVTGYWGGNVAAEYEITVAAAPSKAKAAKRKAG